MNPLSSKSKTDLVNITTSGIDDQHANPSLAIAAQAFMRFVEVLEKILDEADNKKTTSAPIKELGSILPSHTKDSPLYLLSTSISTLEELLKNRTFSSEDVDKAMKDMQVSLELFLSKKPNLGPSNPGTPMDWFLAAIGLLCETLIKIAFIEYVRIKAGNFGAAQEVQYTKSKLKQAKGFLNWISQDPDSENQLLSSRSEVQPEASGGDIRFKCPHCNAPFGGFSVLPTDVECPSCRRSFKPQAEQVVARESKEDLAHTIRSHFTNVNSGLADQICDFLAYDPPLPGKGGYDGRDEQIKEFINEAISSKRKTIRQRLFRTRKDNFSLLEAMMRTFAEAQDWYFCHYLWDKYTVSTDIENFVAQKAMTAPHLGGQSGDYFHLLAILCKRRNDIRQWCERVRAENGSSSILGENMTFVLEGRA